jgi:very-short-patch-repair endonuclease
MTTAEYRKLAGKSDEESEADKLARTFEFHVRARRLPPPRWKFGPGGELKFAADEVQLPRQNRRKKTKAAPAWRWDFAWPDHRVAVEIEGLVVYRDKATGHMQTRGRHTTPQGFNDDCEKYAWGAVLGWRVMRFTPVQVKRGFAIDMVVRMFAALEVLPQPLVVSIDDVLAAAAQPGLGLEQANTLTKPPF